MSDPKRPGTSRDISELKARLGLKKAAPPTPAKSNQGGGNAVVAPPGVSLPAGPVVPSAHDDPFGAMNAMAHIGTMQRAPEIVIVNDGKPVEHVGAGKVAGGFIKYLIIALVPLALGIVVGQIAKEANIYNAGISDAKQLLENKEAGVSAMKRKVVELQAVLEEAARSGFAPSKDLTAKLEAILPKIDIKQDVVFRAKQNSLSAGLSGEILGFYSTVTEIKSMLSDHITAAKSDDKVLDVAKEAGDRARPQGYQAMLGGAYRYGILITAPEGDGGGQFGGKLVELGQPYCSDGNMSRDFTCSDGNYSAGVTYRFDPNALWIKGDPQTSGNSADAKKVIPLLATGIADVAVRGTGPGASETLYIRRLEALKVKVDALVNQGNSVENKLRPKAKEAEKFHFFVL